MPLLSSDSYFVISQNIKEVRNISTPHLITLFIISMSLSLAISWIHIFYKELAQNDHAYSCCHVCSALSSIVSASLLMNVQPEAGLTHKPYSISNTQNLPILYFSQNIQTNLFSLKHKCSLCHNKSKVTWLVEWFRITVGQSDLSAAVQFRPWRWSRHSSKTSLTTSKLTSHHIPEDLNCHTNYCLTPVTGARNFNILNDTSL
jgi:hypothetical protein